LVENTECMEDENKKIQELELQYSKYEKVHPFCLCALSGVFGGQSVMFGKMVAELISTSIDGEVQILNLWFPLFLISMFLCVFSQLHFLAVALNFFDALYCVPVFQCFFISVSTIGGASFFGEFGRFSTTQAVLFPIGLIMTLTGVIVLSSRKMGRQIVPHSLSSDDLASQLNQGTRLTYAEDPDKGWYGVNFDGERFKENTNNKKKNLAQGISTNTNGIQLTSIGSIDDAGDSNPFETTNNLDDLKNALNRNNPNDNVNNESVDSKSSSVGPHSNPQTPQSVPSSTKHKLSHARSNRNSPAMQPVHNINNVSIATNENENMQPITLTPTSNNNNNPATIDESNPADVVSPSVPHSTKHSPVYPSTPLSADHERMLAMKRLSSLGHHVMGLYANIPVVGAIAHAYAMNKSQQLINQQQTILRELNQSLAADNNANTSPMPSIDEMAIDKSTGNPVNPFQTSDVVTIIDNKENESNDNNNNNNRSNSTSNRGTPVPISTPASIPSSNNIIPMLAPPDAQVLSIPSLEDLTVTSSYNPNDESFPQLIPNTNSKNNNNNSNNNNDGNNDKLPLADQGNSPSANNDNNNQPLLKDSANKRVGNAKINLSPYNNMNTLLLDNPYLSFGPPFTRPSTLPAAPVSTLANTANPVQVFKSIINEFKGSSNTPSQAESKIVESSVVAVPELSLAAEESHNLALNSLTVNSLLSTSGSNRLDSEVITDIERLEEQESNKDNAKDEELV